jgi:hypothetical protein
MGLPFVRTILSLGCALSTDALEKVAVYEFRVSVDEMFNAEELNVCPETAAPAAVRPMIESCIDALVVDPAANFK